MNLAALPVALCAGGSVGCTVVALFPPPRKLGPRVAPYTLAARSRMGDTSDEVAQMLSAPPPSGSAVGRVFAPIGRSLVDRFSAVAGFGDEEAVALALDRAGIVGVTPRSFATSQMLGALFGFGAGAAGGSIFGVRVAILFAMIGAVVGWRHRWADLRSRIARRREVMRAELLVIANVLAIHTRANPNVQSAVADVCAKGSGEVVRELRGILASVAAGTPSRDAYARARERTAEPAAGRLYDVLSKAVSSGGDVGNALRAQVRDLRQLARDDARRRGDRQKLKVVGASTLLMPLPIFILTFPLLMHLVRTN